ncbi:MCE family protein, partial [Sulfurimonas sp. MAG313]
MHEEDKTSYERGLNKSERGFSLVWIVPIVAIIITLGMIYKSYVDKGTRIYITIDNGKGIMDGNTPLMYKGIQIGSVEDVSINENDVSKLLLTVVVDKASSSAVTRKGNKFWKVEPKISLTEITGLDTLIKGVYIAVMPAATTKEALLDLPYETSFIALEKPPVDVFKPGLSLLVNTINKGDISVGAPVLYNKQTIGKVEDKQLSLDKRSINIYIRIEEKYADLIHDKSFFYKMDAIEVKAGLRNVTINMGSFASFIAGGISVHNTKASFQSPLSKDKQNFHLYDSYEEIMFSSDTIELTLQANHSLTSGVSKVFYQGVEAGLIKTISYDPKKNETRVSIKLRKNFRGFANKEAYFWLVQARLGFDGVKGLDTIIAGNYINFISKDTQALKQTNFILHNKEPSIKGQHISLICEDMESLKEGAGVFYHNIKIGVIDTYALNSDNKTFTIDAVITPKYTRLLNASSRFYHNSGVSFSASLTKLTVDTGSAETILRGGISVETPQFKNIKKIKKSYKLYSNRDAIQKASHLAKNGVYLTLIAPKAGSLKKGSPVFYKQIEVGEVLSTYWDSPSQKLKLRIFIREAYAKEVHPNTLFYNASGINAKIGLNGLSIAMESLETIIAGGVSFFTPSSYKQKPVKNNSSFTLYNTKEEASNTYFTIKFLAKDSFGLKV